MPLRHTVVALVGVLSVTAPSSTAAAWGAPVHAPIGAAPSASCGVAFHRFGFSPSAVAEGRTTTLVAVVHNCATQDFSGSLETFGRLACLVVDPIDRPLSVPRGRTVRVTADYTAPLCAGTGEITGRLLSSSGAIVSSAQARLRIVA
jgi:hypothetical protein